MGERLFSLTTPSPQGFSFCTEFRMRDFRGAPFALHADSYDQATRFLGGHLPRLAGVILVPGDSFQEEEVTPHLSWLSYPPPLETVLEQLAQPRLRAIERALKDHDKIAHLTLECSRLTLNNQRTAEEYSQFRMSLLREIDDRRTTERQLAQSEQLQRLIMSSTSEAIAGINTEGVCAFANEAFVRILGYEQLREVLGRSIHALVHHGQAPEVSGGGDTNCAIHQVVKTGQSIVLAEDTYWRRDGKSFPVECSVAPTRKDGESVGAVLVFRDITERKKAETELRNQKKMLSEILDTIPQYVFWKDIESRYLGCNRSFAQSAGMQLPEDLIGKTDHDLPWAPHAAQYLADDEEVMSSNCSKSDIIEPLIHASGQRRWINTTKIPLLDDTGAVCGVVGVFEDVTEKRAAEEERLKLERQLLHAQKLESLGVLAGGIAHDFNNILMAIIGHADLALMGLPKESPVVDSLKSIEEAAARAADLAKQMLAYSGKGRFVVERLDLNRLVQEMRPILDISISKRALLSLNLASRIPAIEADATQLRQVVMNLVVNASEALGEQPGAIEISTGLVHCDQAMLRDAWLDDSITEGPYDYLEVQDTGCGISKETLGKIFDPFFTTKFTGRGLGMAAVLGIVRGHKGAIKVESEVGKGTTFRILLPAASPIPEAQALPAQVTNWKGTGKVMLVDDEEAVRMIGRAMLRELGFEVLTAADGVEALELYRRNPDICCIILDLIMPKLDGERCFRELQALDPNVKVLISSGYNQQLVDDRFSGQGPSGFLQKPYRMAVLRDAIRSLLNA